MKQLVEHMFENAKMKRGVNVTKSTQEREGKDDVLPSGNESDMSYTTIPLRKAWNDDDDVLDVFGLDSRYERFRNHVFGLYRIEMDWRKDLASYACNIDMPIEVGRAWKLMCTSKRYAWPNCKASNKN
ncbi:hypothetical protein Tco_1458099 [Tanacetum coccineum]